MRYMNPGQIEYMKAVARWVKNGDRIKSRYYLMNGHNKSIRHITARAGLLLPNSHSEYNRFSKNFRINHRYRKVVNAIEPSLFTADSEPNPEFTDHVLCVGRIEGRKNQLNLIKAVMETDLKLTIIGKPSPNHLDYYNECRSIAAGNPNIRFIDHLSHAELVSIYKAAKVHALPSWFETTGLSSLEAGVMGCNLVITKKGDTEEYFGDLVSYCDVVDLRSIRSALLTAYKKPKSTKLQAQILQCYSWQQTAEQTLAAYTFTFQAKQCG